MRNRYWAYFGILLATLAAGGWMAPPIVWATLGVQPDDAPSATVVSVQEGELVPVVQPPTVADEELIGVLLLSSTDVPSSWEQQGASVNLAPTQAGERGRLEIQIRTRVVAVAYHTAASPELHYGVGLHSTVTLNGRIGSSTWSTNEQAFRNIHDCATPSQALDHAETLVDQLAQTSPPPVSSYGSCVTDCIAAAHNRWWGPVADCLAALGLAEAATLGGCALGCLLAGPAWVVCATLCIETIGIAVTLALSQGFATCLVTYIAAIAVAIPACTIGCWW